MYFLLKNMSFLRKAPVFDGISNIITLRNADFPHFFEICRHAGTACRRQPRALPSRPGRAPRIRSAADSPAGFAVLPSLPPFQETDSVGKDSAIRKHASAQNKKKTEVRHDIFRHFRDYNLRYKTSTAVLFLFIRSAR